MCSNINNKKAKTNKIDKSTYDYKKKKSILHRIMKIF